MVDITVSGKRMKPAVVHTDQFEDGVHVLRFTLDDYYTQEGVDLREFKAYVVTSLNGSMDITHVPYTVSGRKMILTWELNSFTLRNPGVIQYQIRFSKSAEDDTAVWYSHKGLVVNRLTINADDYISANYPTLLKQNEDLIQTLSGSFGAEIVYMAAGESIPVERRVAKRLYYQWLEIPSSRATCATGTLNLGSRPYADSGLYINGVHIFIDDTADTAFAIEAATWIDAINAANCGVVATDISTNEDITILLTAAKAGSAGNSITLLLGQALYGSCAYTSNPSKGTVSGVTLVGGSDQQAGVKYPTGRFEDAHGNILGYSRAKYMADVPLETILENGEYICAGSSSTLNMPIDSFTYCILRVTDSTSTNRILQECYCVSVADNTVRTFIRALTSATDVGEWRELMGESIGDNRSAMVGEVKYLAHDNTPTGWLLCDGSAVSRTKYSKLFNTIGTKWGNGDGSTTFNVPNLIGRVIWGAETAGEYIEAGLPNITGTAMGGADYTLTASGAFSANRGRAGGGEGEWNNWHLVFDASKSNSIYGNSDTVQPPSATLRPFIKY